MCTFVRCELGPGLEDERRGREKENVDQELGLGIREGKRMKRNETDRRLSTTAMTSVEQ